MRTNRLLLTVPLALAACSRPAPGTRPYDDSAIGHRQQAAEHQAEADEALAYAGSKAYYQSVRLEHEQLAAAHLRAAEQLDAAQAAACQGRPAPATWPQVRSIDEVPGGVVLHLPADAGSEKEVLTRLQCQRATLAVDGFDRHPDDPLAVEDLDVVVHAEPGGTAVMLGAEDDARIDDLRRRAAAISRPR